MWFIYTTHLNSFTFSLCFLKVFFIQYFNWKPILLMIQSYFSCTFDIHNGICGISNVSIPLNGNSMHNPKLWAPFVTKYQENRTVNSILPQSVYFVHFSIGYKPWLNYLFMHAMTSNQKRRYKSSMVEYWLHSQNMHIAHCCMYCIKNTYK